MRWNIARIWLVWLVMMAVLAGIMWVLFMLPLPGFSSGLPTLAEVLEYLGHIGIGQTIWLVALIVMPPILLTYFEIWKARRRGSPSFASGRLNLGGFLGRRRARVTVTIDLERFRFEGPGVREGGAIEAATAIRVGHDLEVGAIGDEALAQSATGVLIRPFAAQPQHDGRWLHEEPLIHYCRYYLMLASARRTHLFSVSPRPMITVHKAHRLRAFFRGRETEILDRVFRAAGASVVTFA